MRIRYVFYILVFIFTGIFTAISAHAADDDKPLWEYGFGIGYAKYAQYPASNEYSELILPFPTFQYRGQVLRADDQDGGRAYLLKDQHWSLEFSGGGRLPLDSSKNKSRDGMDNLPLVIELGPQLVYSIDHIWEFKIAAFPSLAIDGAFIKQNGGVATAQALYRWENEWKAAPFESPLLFNGTFTLEATTASQEFNATYFEVQEKFATASRPAYNAKSGFLENSVSYFQRISSGKLTVYLAASYSDYTNSVNRQSPLHKSDGNMEYGMGLTYVLGESSRRSVAPEDTEGLINKALEKRRQRLIHFE